MTEVNVAIANEQDVFANIDALIAAAERKEDTQRIIDEAKASVYAEAGAEDAIADIASTINITPVFTEGDFSVLRKTVDSVIVEEVSQAVGAEFDRRMTFHKDTDVENTNIQKNLGIYRRQMSAPHTASVLVTCSTDISFINRTKRGEQCFNVYSIDKVGRLVNQMVLGVANNKYNDAIFKSMWNFMKAGVQFTSDHAKAAISDKIRVTDSQIKSLLVRHTVKPGTASTQASSSLRAMEVLGIARNAGTEKKQVWVLNDNPQMRAIAASYKLS